MSAFYDLASLVVVPSGYKSGKIYAQRPLTTDGQLTFTRASTATRVNASGLIESVASGVPRLDYLNSSCPRLLLEPQRTNLVLYSEQLNDVEWSKTGGLTVSANQTTSPSGYVDADKVIVGSNQFGELRSSQSSQAAGAYSASIFVKKGDLSWCVLQVSNTTDYARTWFNIETGVIGSNDASVWTLNSSKIESYSNGWYRISISVTTTATTPNRLVLLAATGDGIFGAALNTYFFAWGGQVEAGAYATSYIPTLGTSVTRVADAASKTGISSLIGQTEGTIFWDFNIPQIATAGTYTRLILSDGTSSNTMDLIFYSNGRIQFTAFVSGSIVVNINLPSYGLTAGNHKFALAYKLNDYVAYVDGVSVGTDTSAAVPAMSAISFYDTAGIGLSRLSQALLFKTRLTNAQLAELTTL